MHDDQRKERKKRRKRTKKRKGSAKQRHRGHTAVVARTVARAGGLSVALSPNHRRFLLPGSDSRRLRLPQLSRPVATTSSSKQAVLVFVFACSPGPEEIRDLTEESLLLFPSLPRSARRSINQARSCCCRKRKRLRGKILFLFVSS